MNTARLGPLYSNSSSQSNHNNNDSRNESCMDNITNVDIEGISMLHFT